MLASVLPADFPRDVFSGWWALVDPGITRRQPATDGYRRPGRGRVRCSRAFKSGLRPNDIAAAQAAAVKVWGHLPTVLDPMAGGGSIPLESARLGFPTLANEYNPVACSILEVTVDRPFHFGSRIAERQA